MLKKFAEELKEHRIKSDISLQQLHAKTRIDIKFLEAIENGSFEILPEVYLRAFLKDYAKSIGLDETLTIKKYDAARAGKLHEEKEAIEPVEPEKVEKQSDAKKYVTEDISGTYHEEPHRSTYKRNNVFWGITAISLLLIVVIVYLFIFKGSSDIITERPYEEIINENKEKSNSGSPAINGTANDTSATALQETSVKDSLTLIIRADDTSWMLIKVDNSSLIEDFILRPNTQKTIRAAHKYYITVGNSAGVDLFLNSKNLGFTGRNKEVKNVQIDSTGLKYIN